jgi:hypothetical protein
VNIENVAQKRLAGIEIEAIWRRLVFWVGTRNARFGRVRDLSPVAQLMELRSASAVHKFMPQIIEIAFLNQPRKQSTLWVSQIQAPMKGFNMWYCSG